MVSWVSGPGACDGLIETPRTIQFWAAESQTRRRRGTSPGAAATVIGAAL